MVQANNLSTLVAETGETDVENHPQLYIDFVVVLSNKIPRSKKKNVSCFTPWIWPSFLLS